MESLVNLLSNAQQMDSIMKNIAGYIIYFYPGIISIYLFNFFSAKKTKDTQAFIIKSFAISYLYNLILQYLLTKLGFLKQGMDKNMVAYNICLLFISFFVPYIVYRIKNSKCFTCICGKMKISTSVTDVPFELMEDENEEYTSLKVYLKDDPYVYMGFIQEYEYENEVEKYVILACFRKYLVNKKVQEKLLEGHERDAYDEKVFIKFSDIKRIEKISETRAKEYYSKEK